ncbi:hypothetical protein SDC9_86638 [bioreactor metagenome]|uniref:Uncharacterized protein n=1 Tax=bioreactor metagenome TaxID=1076179 RepID=A0A644ZGM5_9ZZZZ
MSQRLKGRQHHNAEAGKQVAQTDDSERRNADGQHIRRSFEQKQQLCGQQLQGQQAAEHHNDRIDNRQAEGLDNPCFFLGAEVIRNNGNHAVVETKNRHKDEALQLEVNAEQRRGGGGEGNQDQVHAVGHNRGNGGHGNAGDSHRVNMADNCQLRVQNTAQAELNFLIEHLVKGKAGGRGSYLTDDSGNGGAGNLKARKAKQTKDKYGVQNDIDDSADQLGNHGVKGQPGGLEQPGHGDLSEKAEGQHAAPEQIVGAILKNLGDIRLACKIQINAEKANQGKNGVVYGGQENGVVGNFVYKPKVAGAEAAGQLGVHTHAGADADGDHQVLHGEREGNGCKRVLTETGNKHAVHHIVKRLYQHGQHHGY